MGKKINLLKKYPSSKRNVDRIQGNKKKYLNNYLKNKK